MKTPFDNFEIAKYYRITVTLKDEQEDRNGNYAVTCLNLNGTIAPYIIPVKILCYTAIDFKSMKEFINSLVETQIEKVEIRYE